MDDPKKLLKLYVDFRAKIKSLKNSSTSKHEPCIIVSKEDLANWKKFFLYSKELINNYSLQNEWESKIKNKKYLKKPIFNILSDYKAIKNHLSKEKGISLLNKEFISFYTQSNQNLNQVNCYFGNQKTVIAIYGGLSFSDCLICKIGSKSSSQYIIYETIYNYKSSLIDIIINKKNTLVAKKTSFPSYDINKIITYGCKKIQQNNNNESDIKDNINYHDINFNNNNHDFNTKDKINKSVNVFDSKITGLTEDENNIPDSIFQLLILLYKFNKDIKNKIKTKDKSREQLYLINSGFLNNIKLSYNYNDICKELEKFKYNTEREFEYKISYFINLIKQKNIINEQVPLIDIDFEPEIKNCYSTNHYINFSLINEKIYNIIPKIIEDFGFDSPLKQLKYIFYFKPELFYISENFSKGKYIKIGALNEDFVFEIHYFILLDLYNSSLYPIVYDLNNSKSLKQFFVSKSINNIDEKPTHNLIHNYSKHGTVTNFLYKGSNYIEDKKPDYKLRANVKKKPENIPYQKKITPGFSIKNEPTDMPLTDLSYLDNFKIKHFNEIKSTPMIGLQNIGQTCYMNAALQCFSNTKALTSYFLNSKKLDYIKTSTVTNNTPDKPSLVVEYLKLVRHLWCDPIKSYYAPYEFKKAIGKIDSLFENFEANDAKDFVNFMIMRMHDELNYVDANLIKETNLIQPPMPINPYDQKQVLLSYLYEFNQNFQSIISNCFYGTTQGEFECQNCKMQLFQTRQNFPLTKYNYQTYFFLNFPLDEVRKYILSNQQLYMKYMSSNVNPNLEVNLLDCFYYYQKDEYLGCYCDRCQNNNAQVLTRTKLYVAPIYLILLFNRGKGIEFNIKITFPEFLDTKGIFINPTGMYRLYGVVKHFGDSSSSGHFTAYCRSPKDDLWYFYNDATVTPVNEQEKYRIQENGLTYMLFYSQMSNK